MSIISTKFINRNTSINQLNGRKLKSRYRRRRNQQEISQLASWATEKLRIGEAGSREALGCSEECLISYNSCTFLYCDHQSPLPHTTQPSRKPFVDNLLWQESSYPTASPNKNYYILIELPLSDIKTKKWLATKRCRQPSGWHSLLQVITLIMI